MAGTAIARLFTHGRSQAVWLPKEFRLPGDRVRVRERRVQENTERLRILLSGDLDLLDFDDEDAQAAGRIRAALEKTGTPIGAYDLLIADQALRRGLTVVTAESWCPQRDSNPCRRLERAVS